jgi:proteasome alpha subunit
MTEIRTVIPDDVDQFIEAMVRTGPFSSKAELVRAALVSYAQTVGPLAHEFDKDLHFSPDGRLYQVEYARESAHRGSPVAGIVAQDGVLLAAKKGPTPGMPGLILTPGQKIAKLTSRVAMAGVGLVADFAAVRRIFAEKTFRETDRLMQEVQDYFWQRTTQRGLRPVGCALLVGSTLEGQPRLFYVDPSASVSEVSFHVFGHGDGGAAELLARACKTPLHLKESEGAALKALGNPDQFEITRLTL